MLLVNQLKAQLAAHGGKLTRANVVTAMATAATQDLDGVTVLPQLLAYLQEPARAAGRRRHARPSCRTGSPSGAHRKKAAAGDAQYDHAAAVAIDDTLIPLVIHAVYDPLLAAGGTGAVGTNGGATAGGLHASCRCRSSTPPTAAAPTSAARSTPATRATC